MNREFFITNRQKLIKKLPGSLMVLTNYYEVQRRHDEANQFISESNFWYLCGIDLPGWRLIIDAKLNRSYAVYPVLSEVKQVFDGGWDLDGIKQMSGVNEIISADEADSLLLRLRREHRLVYTVQELVYIKKQSNITLNSAQKDLSEYLSHRFESVHDGRGYIEALRVIKQPEEIKAIQRAASITKQAYMSLVEQLATMKYEYQVEALLNYEFRRQGGDGPAYHTIVASGKNACTLHYIANNDQLKRRSILLVDAAASYCHYSADVTRCLPIGQPTARQKAVYQEVKSVFDQIVRNLKPGLSLIDLQKSANDLTKEALRSLSLDHSEEGIRRYFPHAIGHSLGLDTHDTFGEERELREGMVLTIEPGIYIPDEAIGVRYEDDFLITSNGAKNLTESIGDIWYNVN